MDQLFGLQHRRTDPMIALPGTKGFERASSWDKTWNKYSSHK